MFELSGELRYWLEDCRIYLFKTNKAKLEDVDMSPRKGERENIHFDNE